MVYSALGPHFLVPDHKVFESAAEALISIVEMTELFPFIIKVDLYGGIYSIYDSTPGARDYC